MPLSFQGKQKKNDEFVPDRQSVTSLATNMPALTALFYLYSLSHYTEAYSAKVKLESSTNWRSAGRNQWRHSYILTVTLILKETLVRWFI